MYKPTRNENTYERGKFRFNNQVLDEGPVQPPNTQQGTIVTPEIPRFTKEGMPTVWPFSKLTRCEWEVVRLHIEGCLNKTIAEIRGIKPETVSTHLGKAVGKLGLKSKEGLCTLAIESGLLTTAWKPRCAHTSREASD